MLVDPFNYIAGHPNIQDRIILITHKIHIASLVLKYHCGNWKFSSDNNSSICSLTANQFALISLYPTNLKEIRIFQYCQPLIMKFNWISVNEVDEKVKKLCIDIEYKLRPKITRFLMSKLEQECGGDFSCFHFDVDLEKQNVSIARPTPLKYKRRIAIDFDREINQNFISELIPLLRAG